MTTSTSTTPYTVTPSGIQLPEGVTFEANGHINVKVTTADGTYIRDAGIHFDPNNWHPGGAYIGQSFYPVQLAEGECIGWVQVHGYNEHFGEGGQAPACLPSEEVPPVVEPEPTPEPEEPVLPVAEAPIFTDDTCEGDPYLQYHQIEGVTYIVNGAPAGSADVSEGAIEAAGGSLFVEVKALADDGTTLGEWTHTYTLAIDCEVTPQPEPEPTKPLRCEGKGADPASAFRDDCWLKPGATREQACAEDPSWWECEDVTVIDRPHPCWPYGCAPDYDMVLPPFDLGVEEQQPVTPPTQRPDELPVTGGEGLAFAGIATGLLIAGAAVLAAAKLARRKRHA